MSREKGTIGTKRFPLLSVTSIENRNSDPSTRRELRFPIDSSANNPTQEKATPTQELVRSIGRKEKGSLSSKKKKSRLDRMNSNGSSTKKRERIKYN